MMRISLFRRELGIGSKIKSLSVDGVLSDFVRREDCVDERKLLNAMPDGFLPCNPRYILISVSDSVNSSTGQRGLSIFKNWAKYFNAYFLLLENESQGSA